MASATVAKAAAGTATGAMAATPAVSSSVVPPPTLVRPAHSPEINGTAVQAQGGYTPAPPPLGVLSLRNGLHLGSARRAVCGQKPTTRYLGWYPPTPLAP